MSTPPPTYSFFTKLSTVNLDRGGQPIVVDFDADPQGAGIADGAIFLRTERSLYRIE